MKRSLLLILALACVLCACGRQAAPAPAAEAPAAEVAEEFQSLRHAEITIRDYGTVKLELDEGSAPKI